MTSDSDALLGQVIDALARSGVNFALIGAAALAVHGVSRSTFDIDLLVTDSRILDQAFWTSLSRTASVEVRKGDATDPLIGVVRCRAAGQRDVDLVVGKGRWQEDLLARAMPIRRGGRPLPTVRVEDLILLKLYAGGSQDRWDIEQLLAVSDRQALIGAVEARLSDAPTSARQVWRTIVPA